MELRCKQCKKMLAKVKDSVTTIPNESLKAIQQVEGIDKDTAKLEIKCPRCKTLNEVVV